MPSAHDGQGCSGVLAFSSSANLMASSAFWRRLSNAPVRFSSVCLRFLLAPRRAFFM
eukprot:CAMPEP_0182846640 /NCGR_PEP_ID=MMETSP0006_2-20121128/28012_1 /TAXON_ID=97485 /ORGANISM="Prymnesium parvum, Strain Texoma1" /LENGTH=56 /DNA_ID=CAMNT_0024976879 /DNA_START=216 /DNA_END=386 /DNA_ORIENTATION=+